MRRDQRGITLFEILTAISLAVMVSIFIAVSYRNYQKRIQTLSAVEEVEGILRQAQSAAMAVQNNAEHGVYFDADEDTYTLFEGSEFIDGTPGNIIYKLPSPIGIETLGLADDETFVVFAKLTGATDQSGTVEISYNSDTSYSYTILITDAGRVTITD